MRAQDSCGTSAPSLDSTDHYAAASREGLFPSFITSFFFCFTTPLLLSPILSPLTVFFLFSTLRYFSTRPCSNIFFSCFLHGVSGFIRLVQRGRKGMKRAGGMYEKVLDELDLNSSALCSPLCCSRHGVSHSLDL